MGSGLSVAEKLVPQDSHPELVLKVLEVLRHLVERLWLLLAGYEGLRRLNQNYRVIDVILIVVVTIIPLLIQARQSYRLLLLVRASCCRVHHVHVTYWASDGWHGKVVFDACSLWLKRVFKSRVIVIILPVVIIHLLRVHHVLVDDGLIFVVDPLLIQILKYLVVVLVEPFVPILDDARVHFG